MNWTDLIKAEVESTYTVTEKLIARVDDAALTWKPATGENWMTTGQLLFHLTQGCGMAFRALVTGDWGLPEGKTFEDLPPEDKMPPAEKLPAVLSAAEARTLLNADRVLALEMLAKAGEPRLAAEPAPVPWDPSPMVLGRRMLQMVDHQKQHKGQLFYYLKLQGVPVSTPDLWGE
jgi:uncharacterized damage-inducible protein DinB